MRLGFGEIVLILIVALLIFGPSKLPQLGDALGKGIRSFRRATEGSEDAPAPAVAAKPDLPASAQAAPAPASAQAAVERAGPSA
jgi:sec-independent protein translocase protein TatA